MTGIGRWLLLPCLAPIAAVLLLSAVHRSQPIQLQFLIWRTPTLPLGVWTALATGTGAAFSGLTVLLLLPGGAPLQRTTHQRLDSAPQRSSEADPATGFNPMPERDIRDPAPTVSVPFRVIQRPVERRRADDRVTDHHTSHQKDGMPSSEPNDWGDDPDRDW